MNANSEYSVSVVVPVYGCAGTLPTLSERVDEALKGVCDRHELVLVDDRAGDGAWKRMQEIAAVDPNVRAVRLSRNFGQHAAITAGLAYSTGSHVIVMDCDLQDDPAEIPKLLNRARETGADIVFARRISRQHSWFKNVTAGAFNWVFNFLSDGVQSGSDIGSFSLISRRVVDEFLRINDQHRHYLMILGWLGFEKAYVDVEHHPRHEGESSYHLTDLLRHAVDGITSQSTRVLRWSISLGLFFVALSFLAVAYLLVMYFSHGFLQGWASTIVAILMSSGIILTSLGVTGVYIGNIFDQVRDRPIYVVQEVLNIDTRPTDE